MSPLRLRTLALLLVVVPVGLAASLYSGPGRWWINNWGASLAYEVFFIGVAFLFLPSPSRLGAIAVAVCVATCALEFLQLWKPVWLEAVRSTFVGRAVLGNKFSWKDLPAYPLGCLLGWEIIRRFVVRPAPRRA
jgi:hypothetical protein